MYIQNNKRLLKFKYNTSRVILKIYNKKDNPKKIKKRKNIKNYNSKNFKN